ncbi:MAG: hypothetical protein LBL58_00010 [Tannerellaceae bacterium]|jgi:hypothetical protein|nr:hypothetical protein [Tannerellaceae bacterium]
MNIPYEICQNPIVRFNDKIIPDKDENLVYIYSLFGQSVAPTLDGHIGYPFFKNLRKKILFDFENMRIDVIE